MKMWKNILRASRVKFHLPLPSIFLPHTNPPSRFHSCNPNTPSTDLLAFLPLLNLPISLKWSPPHPPTPNPSSLPSSTLPPSPPNPALRQTFLFGKKHINQVIYNGLAVKWKINPAVQFDTEINNTTKHSGHTHIDLPPEKDELNKYASKLCTTILIRYYWVCEAIFTRKYIVFIYQQQVHCTNLLLLC